jgi:two-component system phosphate regulon sensor histidine kinase PhoR
MSLRFKFLLFLSSAVVAGLLVGSVWNLRTRLAIIFSLLAGVILGKLFTSWKEETKALLPATPALSAESKRAEEAAEARAAVLLETMMNGMREGILVVDEQLRVVASNRAARGFFRSIENPLKETRLSDWTRNPTIHSAFAASLDKNEVTETKVEVKGADGSIFDLRVVPLRLDGESRRGAMGVFFNITRLERLERVRQEFLSNVSHELRTPLTAIIAFVETLEDGAIDDHESNARFLEIIRKNAERMHNLIDDILELSAIEAGTVTVEIEPVRLHALVGDVLTALASRAQARRIELKNEVTADAIVNGDARRLEQMLTNLVDNAIKFNREEGLVTIRHEREDARDRIHVTDTGDGILPEHVKRIFERFYRIDRARSRAMGGTGLGLAIVKHLARAHNGEVSVQSTPGAGSTFIIELPAHAPKKVEEENSPRQSIEQSSEEHTAHALR